ncbi:alanine racemase [Bartonella sp. DGB1]|uniref:alanine racemase n=1 Tax=Bartonella sp. DGB1 TaxID=3239807 RepID=UPI003525CAE9
MSTTTFNNYKPRIIVSHKNLSHNYHVLKQQAHDVPIAAVIKANGYGLGDIEIAKTLYQQGCREYFVAHFTEALKINTILPPDRSIYVLNGPENGNIECYLKYNITPIINNLEQLNEWYNFAKNNHIKPTILLQIDTGMARLGLDIDCLTSMVNITEIIKMLDIKYIISHLSQSEIPLASSNEKQLNLFTQTVNNFFPKIKSSLSNSHGMFLEKKFHKDLIRCGISIYGLTNNSTIQEKLKPIAQVQACVIQIRNVKAGTAIGYNETYITTEDTQIATLAIGYGNGLSRQLSNKGCFYYKNKELPIVGTISMDVTTVDISALKEQDLQLYSWVDLISSQQTWSDLANKANSIPYECLTNLGKGCEKIHQLI